MKHQRVTLVLIVLYALSGAATSDTLSGTVHDENGTAVAGADVTLASNKVPGATTDSVGLFTIIVSRTGVVLPDYSLSGNDLHLVLHDKELQFTTRSGCARATIGLFRSNGSMVFSLETGALPAGVHKKEIPALSAGYYLVRTVVDGITTTHELMATGQRYYLGRSGRGSFKIGRSLTVAANAVDTLVIAKTGYITARTPLESYSKKDVAIVLKKEGGTSPECAEFTIPSSFSATNAKMPDPFTFLSGNRLIKKEEWLCRRNEIRALAEATVYGTKPPRPDKVEASFSNGKLTITSTVGSASKSFTVSISGIPSGDGPHPAIISFGSGGMSIGPSIPAGVATISYPQDNVASEQNPRPAKGVFNDLYPELRDNQGALIGWAWGLSRIVDALELDDIRAATKIDPKRLGTMGCSRWGKGAGMAVFDDRIMLPIVLSPGSGFSSTWRIAETQGNVQKAGQIYGECTWMGAVFQKFGGNGVNKLPIDQHEVIAMRAPRPLVLLEATDDSWNCPVCCYHAAKYASFVYDALGVGDNFGWGHEAHGHCGQSKSTSQLNIMNAFVDRFLLNKEVSTAGMFKESFTFDKNKWQEGDVPELEGDPLDVNTILWDE